jgi:hypothetical protein
MFKGLNEIHNHEDRKNKKKIKEAQRLLNKENRTLLEEEKIQKYLNNQAPDEQFRTYGNNLTNNVTNNVTNKTLNEEKKMKKMEKLRIIEENRILRKTKADAIAKEVEERLQKMVERRQKEAEELRQKEAERRQKESEEQWQKEAERRQKYAEEHAQHAQHAQHEINKKALLNREITISHKIIAEYNVMMQSADNLTLDQCYRKLSLKYHPDKTEGNTSEYMVILNKLKDIKFNYMHV